MSASVPLFDAALPATGRSATRKASDAIRPDASGARPFIDAAGRLIHWCGHAGCRKWGALGQGIPDPKRYAEAVAKGDARAHRFLGLWRCFGHAGDLEGGR